ncbi:MAG: protein-glutamine gamma-glutamyltransferase [Solirubrobacteraceae bacterium]|jgi:hypothetical protein|nr:protein-glutamine gamma-glutamyltransferase [Solirubrobacteraceae bacterium]
MSAHAVASPPLPGVPAVGRFAGPLLSPRAARLVGFAGLAGLGAAHWALLVAPPDTGRLLLVVGLAAAVSVGLGACARLPGASRHLGAAAVGLGGLALALVVAGIPVRLLAPGGWGELASGLSQGVQTLPDVKVPYAGVDDWPRLAIVSGGAALVVLAALTAFWPTRGANRVGQGLALVLLVALFVVPTVDLTLDHQFLRGTAFAALLAAFLWLERVPRAGGPAAAGALALALGAGLLAAPALDGRGPWVDYERIAESFAPAATTRFDFSHTYGPLDWPRDGREMLRIHAPRSAYWKAENIDEFDGRRWVSAALLAAARRPLSDELPADFATRRRWRERVEVTVRGLQGRDVVSAGTTLDVTRPPSAAVATASPGTYAFEDTLQRGDSYAADVYFPRPSPTALSRAGTGYPQLSPTYWTLGILANVGGGAGSLHQADVRFAPFASGGGPEIARDDSGAFGYGDAGPLLRRSEYRRSWALSQRLAARSRTPYEYARRILAYLGSGFAYTETPGRHAVPLEAFLFDDRAGYCQHFSGAMALLLRMGGVPARVAGGFSPGSYSAKRRDWVVRDIDAHSWVEAYFPGLGWVTFDPTPSAAPARSQLINLNLPRLDAPPGAGSTPQRGDAPEPGPRAADPSGAGAAGSRLPLLAVLAGLLAAGLAGLGFAAARPRRRRGADAPADPALAELRRALRRTGRHGPPGATLAELEGRLTLDGEAAAYLRTLRERRYGFAEATPTRAQRRALRRALGRGLGPAGRARGLYALPPRVRVLH